MSAVLTRVEGEGEVQLITKEGSLIGVEVRIAEPPRFFEYLVKGRRAFDVPDIVSRICGICGVSYILTAVRAFEKGLGVTPPREAEELRLAILGAEKVKSHILHAYYLHLSDFFNTSSLPELVDRNPLLFSNASRVLLWSRKAMEVLGGRFHNVVNIRVGGVYGFPKLDKVAKLLKEMPGVLNSFKYIADVVLSLENIPMDEQGLKLMAVYNGSTYPCIADDIYISYGSGGDLIAVSDFEKFVKCEQASYSNALRYKLINGSEYLVGPLARFNIGYRHLSGESRDLLDSYGWRPPLKNVFQSIVARVAEVHDTLIYLRDFLENYREPSSNPTYERLEPRSGTYVAAIEAPRGLLYHRYEVDDCGRVKYSNIVTPTAQNQASMEAAIMNVIKGEALSGEMAVEKAKRVIRAFDPCISCSVHSIKVEARSIDS
ncbi:MAG: nickel-dependent hydrogenase large subunit [Desulfurococcaceae archaeon]|nr:nickel-dependent hydrogenase large subunit [Sulfolobales archaeon]MDW8170223.1 nickel-dependent hydrogenase large subunit [Desulfurococcaceae archaeon]